MTTQQLLPQTVSSLAFSDAETPSFLCGFIPHADRDTAQETVTNVSQKEDDKLGPRLLPLGISTRLAPEISDNPYCSRKRLFDRYIWLRSPLAFRREGVNYFRQLATAARAVTAIIVKLENLSGVFAIDEAFEPRKLTTTNFWGIRSENQKSTPVGFRSMLRQAATLRSIRDPVVQEYDSRVILVRRALNDAEITAIF